MRRRTKLLLLTVSLIALGAIALRPSQPRYRGHSLDYWAKRVDNAMNQAGLADDEAVAAVRALRTIPEMLQDMDYDGTPLRNRRQAMLRKLPRPLAEPLFHWAMADWRQSREAAAVYILSQRDIDPAAVIPGLERLVTSTNAAISYRSTFVLLSKGTNGLVAFFKAVREPGQGDPVRMIDNLGKIHWPGMQAAATPELIWLSQGEDAAIAQAAHRTLDKMRAEREMRLEVHWASLTNALASLTNANPAFRLWAVKALTQLHGTEPVARAALSNALDDPLPEIRSVAARALTNVVQPATNGSTL